MESGLTDAIVVAYVGLFLACAVTDIWYMRIPNVLVALLAALFFVAALSSDRTVDWIGHLAPALVALAIGVVLFRYDKFGGGDVKLLAVAILWSGMGALSTFLIVLGVAGIVLFIVFRAVREPALFGVTRLQEISGLKFRTPKALDSATHLPYGVAIAVAAIVAARMIVLF